MNLSMGSATAVRWWPRERPKSAHRGRCPIGALHHLLEELASPGAEFGRYLTLSTGKSTWLQAARTARAAPSRLFLNLSRASASWAWVIWSCFQFQPQFVQLGGVMAMRRSTSANQLISGVPITSRALGSNGTDTQERKSWNEWESFQLYLLDQFYK
jgi:hypothetical protein